MTENTKDYSWIMTVKNADGTKKSFNVSDKMRGYRQGWYKTPKSAKKALEYAMNYEKLHGNREIIEAYCFNRSGKRF